MKLCPMQESCQHFATGDNKPKNHDVRNKFPCQLWLSMRCSQMFALYDIIEYCYGVRLGACDIGKVKGIRSDRS